MNKERPYVLSIAGFDPSGGAGILADIKTFEINKVIGLGVCTAITFQNDAEFEGLNWISYDDIKKQNQILFKKFTIDWVKIGLIKDLTELYKIILLLKDLNPNVNIIWDPILKASAGYIFHKEVEQQMLEEVLKHLYLITPNLEEISKLSPSFHIDLAAERINNLCNVLLKGGHRTDGLAVDILYERNDKTSYEGKMLNTSKHGTGCVLSAAILAELAKGKSLNEACKEGKHYTTEFILSHKGLLGYHYHHE